MCKETYLGDGVYATWDGSGIILDLRVQGADKIVLDDFVLEKLVEFWTDCLLKEKENG